MSIEGVITKKINLKLLQAFLVVAERASFKGAADELHRTQAAISAQVKKLEEQIGIKLFHRTTRHVALTADGELLLQYTQRAVDEIEQGLNKVIKNSEQKKGNISLACSPTLVADHLAPLLSVFEKEYPNILLSLLELKSVQLFEAVRNDSVDFALGPLPEGDEFDFEPLYSEQIYLVIHNKLMPRAKREISLAELKDIPIIQFYDNTFLGKMVTETAHKLDISLNVRYQCIQGQTMISLSEAGLGGALVVKSLLNSVTAPNMRKIPVVAPEMHQMFGAIKKKNKKLPIPSIRLLDLLIESATGKRAKQ
jgi:DNA-binding transcriptional LysR family regulator